MDFIIEAVIKAVKDLYQTDIDANAVNLQETRKEFDGQVTVVTFPFTKVSRKGPEQTGTEIGEYLKANVQEIASFNVIKGFLNISIADSYWLAQLNNTILTDDFAVAKPNGKKVMVEYSSPNTNKPLHLGHIRNNLLGFSLSEILAAAGYDVVKANLVNDRGIHICKSMLAWQQFGNGETPQSSGLKGDHLAGKYYVWFDKAYKQQITELIEEGQTEEEAKKNAPLIKQAQEMLQKWEAGDDEVISLWKTMNGWVYEGFAETYKALGVSFDKYYYESDTYLLGKDIVEEGLQKGVFFKKEDGSVWIDLTEDGLDQKLVLRADGTSVYITQDLGTAQLKFNDYHMDESIYVVGNEQDYHFKVLFLILDKLGKSWAKGLYHLSYGMVDLPSGKMKSREGTVVDADDLMADMYDTAKEQTDAAGKVEGLSEEEKNTLYHTIGMGALKYFLLKVDPKKRLLFDPNESVDFQGHTGPFIQYTHARIKSVLAKAGYAGVISTTVNELDGVERDLIVNLTKFPGTIAEAAKSHSPALIANYIYEVAKNYNKFYHEKSISQAETEELKKFRMQLSAATANVIKRGMKLLGIAVPERM
ncbi:arginine--tRNA ligase [Mucilaginibacter conchicola]|uniref:Arginine--tRNA ligase n=1 Tax=Mucilaginibacter conchicola TaxID=2303333 RepID=A0A372NWE1_9SPHI|nr:arginine--tRNA ligase [Mucilaginibacter conchicola]RFZ94234.1 arginine--tRNA ligase [Mucilaginibacter conchicola]